MSCNVNDTICHGYFSLHLQEKLHADIFRVCYLASSGKHREKNQQVDIANLVRNVSYKVNLEVEVRPYIKYHRLRQEMEK